MPAPATPNQPRLVGASQTHDPRADTHDGTPAGNVLTSRGETELQLTWPPVPNATGYRIKFNGGNPVGAAPGQVFTGFTSDSAVNVEVQAFNGVGDSGFSPVRTIFTRPRQPSQPPNLDGFPAGGPLADARVDLLSGSSNVADARGPDFLRLVWTLVAGVTGYQVRLNGGNFQAATVGTPIQGLPVDTEFQIELVSVGNGGRSFRKTSIFWTRPETPERPTLVGTSQTADDPKVDVLGGLQVTTRMENGFHLTWQPKPSANSHEIQVDGGQFMAISPNNTLTVRSPGNAMQPNVSYSVTLTALGDGGRSFRSSRTIFTRPPVPTGLQRTVVDAYLEGVQFFWKDSLQFPDWGPRKWDIGFHDAATIALPIRLGQGQSARVFTDFAFPRIPTNYFVRTQVGDNFSLWTAPLLVLDLHAKTAGYNEIFLPSKTVPASQAIPVTGMTPHTSAANALRRILGLR